MENIMKKFARHPPLCWTMATFPGDMRIDLLHTQKKFYHKGLFFKNEN